MSRMAYFGVLFIEALKQETLENQCISYGCDDPKELDSQYCLDCDIVGDEE